MAQGAAALDPMAPATRTFALRVSVSALETMTTPEEEDVVRIAGEAIGLDPALGDVVSVTGRAWQAPETVAPPVVPPQPWDAEQKAKGGGGKLSRVSWSLALALPLLLVLFWVAFALQRRRAPPRVLTAEQRQEYTDRLKRLLDGREADVAPPA
jgi:hypothetical protein